jgi:hypothetical protein
VGARAGGLGHRRLSIIDLSEKGAQPMVDPHLGLTVVFNGIVYNHRQLRAELEAAGHRFASTSDTEVVLQAYARWGTACVEHFLACSPSPSSSTPPAGWCWPRTGWASSRSTSTPGRACCASPPRCPRCSPPAGWTRTSTAPRWRTT